MGLAFIDQMVIASYFLLVIIIAIVVSRRTNDGDDLFLAGRSLTWGFIGLSLFASNISSTTIIGLAGSAYDNGIVDSVYEWATAIPFMVLAIVFVPLYLRARITTVPEFLERRFDRRSRLFFSALTIAISIIVDTAGGLYAGTLVLQVLFPDLPFFPTALALAVFAGLYTAFGGLKAVVYTDALQAIILIFGCGLVTYLMFAQVGFDWGVVSESIKNTRSAEHLSVVRPIDDATLPWTGLWIAMPFLGFWYVATNQYITQRVLGAKDVNHARWGIMLAGLLKFLPFFIMIVPGLIAIHLYADSPLESGDKVIPFVIQNVLPIGVKGLVLAGLISAIMSSVDSTLNSASTLIVMDFIKTKNREITDRQSVIYGRISTFVLMFIAALWAPLILKAPAGLWGYIQGTFAIFVPSIVVLFLLGTFYKRGNGDGAFWTLCIGILCGLTLFMADFLIGFGVVSATSTGFAGALFGLAETLQMHYAHRIGISLVVSALVFVIVSHMTPAPDQDVIARYTFTKDLITMDMDGLPWYKNYLIQGTGLLFLVGCMYALLW